MSDGPVFDTPPRKSNRPRGTLVPMEFTSTPDGILISQTQDITALLKHTAEMRWADTSNGYNRDRTMKLISLIPNTLAWKWLKEEGINVFDNNHWPAVVRKINDLEYLYLRMSRGRM